MHLVLLVTSVAAVTVLLIRKTRHKAGEPIGEKMIRSFCIPAASLASFGEDPAGVTVHVTSVTDTGYVDVICDGDQKALEDMTARMVEIIKNG
jgi:hypothetical protein